MRSLAVAALALVLAGCSASPAHPPGASASGSLQPGTLVGVVVDQAVRPLAGAAVQVVDAGRNATTDAQGGFRFEGLTAGNHLVRASSPLYDTQQQSVEVPAAGVAPTVRIQLTRQIFAQPYAQVQKFDGFVVCSVGFSLYASEECGEGVGVPCQVPVFGCQRVGGQGNNHAQWDFWLDGPFVRTLVVEMAWDSTSPTLKEFQLNVANDWTCDPFCNGAQLNVTGGPSPLRGAVDFDGVQLVDHNGTKVPLTADTRFSTFVWPNWGSGDPQQLNVAINQPFTQYATAFYYLPAPQGWSFLAGDPLPF
jgi:hypothetical protein